ncbi:MAG TPA: hypothetical protein VHL58_16130 [Thermoanaerobaculia bacterium]|nr:hypothetical protein [Thermoanaerobaculia bacterium]
MARPTRLEIPGGLYWIIARGKDSAVLESAEDGRQFASVLGRVAEMFRWRVHAWVVRPAGFELFIETPEPNLSRGMRELSGNYTQLFNAAHERNGRLMDGRFRGVLVEKGRYFLDIARSIVTAPLREGRARKIERWESSNYPSTSLLTPAPEWLDIETTLRRFDRMNLEVAAEKYRKFAAEKTTFDPAQAITGQIFLGSDSFRKRMEALVHGGASRAAAVSPSRRLWRPELRQIIKGVASALGKRVSEIADGRGGDSRTVVAHLARADAALTLSTVARALHLTVSGTSRLVQQGIRRSAEDPDYRELLVRVRRQIRRA